MLDIKELNKNATIHYLSSEESKILQVIYKDFLNHINSIIKRALLPEANWIPSEDFKWLIKINNKEVN